MAYKLIEIPGASTLHEYNPEVRILGVSDGPISLVITYHAGETEEGRSYLGEITFSQVLEYRWISSLSPYEDIPEHKQDRAFGLIEILHSAYVENMASKGMRREYPGERFGNGLKDADVKHFRLSFDEYGKFDIIAIEVSVKKTVC